MIDKATGKSASSSTARDESDGEQSEGEEMAAVRVE